MKCSKIYGGLDSLDFRRGASRAFIGTVNLMTELCDESRFGKKIAGSLVKLQNGVGDRLFPADTKSWGWQIGIVF
jgi:cytochrome P450/NADPH-cytochrome P450 reductase